MYTWAFSDGEGSARWHTSPSPSDGDSHEIPEESVSHDPDCLPAKGTTVHERFMQALADLNSMHLPGSRGVRARRCSPPNSTLHERFMQALAATEAWQQHRSRPCSSLVVPPLVALLPLLLAVSLCYLCGGRGCLERKTAPTPPYPMYPMCGAATERPGIAGIMQGWRSRLDIGRIIRFFSPWRETRREEWDDFSATDPFDRPPSPTVSEASDTAREDAEREAVLDIPVCTKAQRRCAVDGISGNEVVATLLEDVNNVHELGPPRRLASCDNAPCGVTGQAAARCVGGDESDEAPRRRKAATTARPFSAPGSAMAAAKAALALCKFSAHD